MTWSGRSPPGGLSDTVEKICAGVTRYASRRLLTFLWSEREIIKDATEVLTTRGTGAGAMNVDGSAQHDRYTAVAVRRTPELSLGRGAPPGRPAFAGHTWEPPFHRTDAGPASRVGSVASGQHDAKEQGTPRNGRAVHRWIARHGPLFHPRRTPQYPSKEVVSGHAHAIPAPKVGSFHRCGYNTPTSLSVNGVSVP